MGCGSGADVRDGGEGGASKEVILDLERLRGARRRSDPSAVVV